MSDSELIRLIQLARLKVKNSYSGREAAAILGVSPSTLQRMIDAGKIDTFKIFSYHRITFITLKSTLNKSS